MSGERVAVLGAGAFGTAVSMVLHANGASVRVWGRSPERVRRLQEVRENERYLPGVPLPADLFLTPSADEALDGARIVVVAVPTQFIRVTLESLASALGKASEGAVFLSLAKGIEKKTRLRASEVLSQVLGAPSRRIAVLSGPSHAEELARDLPTTVVVACTAEETARTMQALLGNEILRVYTSQDVLGVELGGALKNVIAVAAGICDGLGLGDNSKAALLTRGLSEITRLGTALGADPATFFGLSGVGDLIATCYSPFGRNREVGERIGKGEILEQVLASMEKVAEGVFTVQAACELAGDHDLEMPIAREMHCILFEGKDPRLAVRDLMLRDPKPETA